MRRNLSLPAIIAGFVSFLAIAPPAYPADPPKIHEMEIYNGPVRTVRLIGDAQLPLTDKIAVQDANRALNEMAIQSELAVLRRQYVNDESALETHRRNVQQILYGYKSTSNNWFYPEFESINYPWNFPFGSTFPTLGFFDQHALRQVTTGRHGHHREPTLAGGSLNFGTAFSFSVNPWSSPCSNGYCNPWSYSSANGFNDGRYCPALLNTYTYSLADGVGNEGQLKTELAHSLLSPAATEAGAAARRSAEAALARVGLSAQGRDYVVLKDGTRLEGKIVKEDADWITLELGGPKETVRMTEVTRIGKVK